ncbi:LytR family transcriptional regulator [Anaerobacillus alkaliphilus]|uniref:LytR family transcriptional regulator n=1 Tax=Anaerobacillus alkaliphilus TaxID=1548597 RepID=A0A4Q0VSW3_9BACI|nr:LCP family protein [Anaerobacillus alkaliphilus]RXJ00417.1 LytR family transcriptional regulator [Anaerobacillus alkaliphilus]
MIPIKKVIICCVVLFGFLAAYSAFQPIDLSQQNQSHMVELEPLEADDVQAFEERVPRISKTENKRPQSPFSIKKTPKPLTMLLFGVDKTTDEKYGRSDSIMLALAQPKTKEIMLMSIPRDTYIEIPGHGYHKLNRSFQLGGPELTRKTVSNWLNIDIQETASIDYTNFEKMIDLIGGIEMNVDRRMAHDEFVIEEGLQRLTGRQALYFVRFRKSLDGNHDSDYKRTERQRQLLTKLSHELLKKRTFRESFALLRSMFKTVDTTLSLQQIITYGHHYSDFSSENITTLSITGEGDRRNGLWFEIIPEEELQDKKTLIKDFLKSDEDTTL